MPVETKTLREYLGPDIVRPCVLVTTGNQAILSNWLSQHFFGRSPRGKQPTEMLWLFLRAEGSSLVTIKSVTTVSLIPNMHQCHLPLAIRPKRVFGEVEILLAAEKFSVADAGEIDENGYGWKMFQAPPEMGNLFVRVARRREGELADVG